MKCEVCDRKIYAGYRVGWQGEWYTVCNSCRQEYEKYLVKEKVRQEKNNIVKRLVDPARPGLGITVFLVIFYSFVYWLKCM